MTRLMPLVRRPVLIGLLLLPVVSQGQSQVASLEVDFTVPTGYVARHEGGLLLLSPQTANDVRTPCVYGLAPPIPSKGSLEVDAGAALVDLTGGSPRITDQRIAMRGVSVAGWPYFLVGGEFRGAMAGEMRDVVFMAMAFPAPANRINVVFGLGALGGGCTFNDVPFAQLFHSLRPRGSQDPPGNALERDLIGTWSGRGLSQHTFYAGGRYSRSASGVLHGGAISGDGDGRYALRGSEITITPGVGGQAPERFRVHIYDRWNNFQWQRGMTVLYDDRRPPYVAEYIRNEP